jgi:peptidoglycan-associated lipoprotein
MTRGRFHIGILTIVVILLAGCGQKTTKTAEPAAPPPTASAPPAEPPPAQKQRPPAEPPGPAPQAIAASPSAAQPTPAGPPQSVDEFTEESALQDVFFGPGRVDIGSSAVRFMRENARWINENPGYLVLIEGHSDYKGTRESNLAMGDRRAKAAATFLLKEGVTDTRLFTVSYGSEQPVCQEKTDSCAAKNRRVHFRVRKR